MTPEERIDLARRIVERGLEEGREISVEVDFSDIEGYRSGPTWDCQCIFCKFDRFVSFVKGLFK